MVMNLTLRLLILDPAIRIPRFYKLKTNDVTKNDGTDTTN